MAYVWPWPRSLYQPILDYCRRQGAKAVAFDLLFTEHSSYGMEDDQTFAAAVSNAPPFAAAVFLGHETGAASVWPENIPRSRLQVSGLEEWLANLPRKKGVLFPKASFPIPELAAGAVLLGNVSARPDADAIFRRIKPFAVFDGAPVPALGVAARLADPEAAGDKIIFSKGAVTIGKHKTALDRTGAAILNFRGRSGTHARISAAAVIQSELKLQAGEKPPAEDMPSLKGCYVFLGCNAPGLLDNRPAPVGRVYTGVELHATALDNLLAGDFMRETPRGIAAALILGLGVVWGMLAALGKSARDNIIAMAIALPLPALICVWAYWRGWWAPFMAPETATIFAIVAAIIFNYATEGRQKRFIRGAFKQYLSEEVIEQLVRHPERLALGGEQRTLSIFFSDLQGFTGISEGLNPQQLTSLLNDYLTAMTDIIQEEGGTVDKYEGDAIIAFWNAPLAQPDHAARAVRATLRCQAKLAQMRPELRGRTGKDLYMRIGLNTGDVVVGNMGSHNRFNYTILGDAANLASRLEGVNKQFGTFTIMAETTYSAMGGAFPARELGKVAVVGRKAPVRIFEPMSREEWSARGAALEQFSAALKEFYGGKFEEALSGFEQIKGKDNAAAAYAEKCRRLFAAPPEQWEGIWVAAEK
jgi:adenylate cyclase